MSRRVQISLAAAALLVSSLACEPLIAVGWQELLLIILLVAFLIGPLIFKLAKAWIRFQESLNKKEK
jgi:hypothetical protein